MPCGPDSDPPPTASDAGRGTPRRRPLAAGALAGAALLALLLGGCASRPTAGGGASPVDGRDGPPESPPGQLARLPDAEPRIEPIRRGGANKPYEVMGQSYEPETRDVPMRQEGLASWYGRRFHGRRTASGELFDMYAMTAAHKTMPLPSYARIRNPANGREIVVRINDRGPFHRDRLVDLSYAAAVRLGIQNGVAKVELERLTHQDIRTGAWRRGAPAEGAAVAGGTAAAPSDAVRAVAAREVSPAGSGAAAAPGAASVERRGAAALPSAVETAARPQTGSSDLAPPGAVAMTATPPTGLPDSAAAPDAMAAVAAAGEAAPVADGPPSQASTPAARGFWVQLGAFRDRGGALDFHRRVAGELDWLAPLMAVSGEASLFRLQAGPYASRDEAQGAAERVREALRLVPVIVERR